MALFKKIIKNIPKTTYERLSISFLILCAGGAITLIKSSSLSFSSGDVSLKLSNNNQIREISNDAAHAIDELTRKIHYLENDVKWLKAVYEGSEVVPVLDSIDQKIQVDIEPTLNEAQKQSHRLRQVAEEVVTQERSGQ